MKSVLQSVHSACTHEAAGSMACQREHAKETTVEPKRGGGGGLVLNPLVWKGGWQTEAGAWDQQAQRTEWIKRGTAGSMLRLRMWCI